MSERDYAIAVLEDMLACLKDGSFMPSQVLLDKPLETTHTVNFQGNDWRVTRYTGERTLTVSGRDVEPRPVLP